MFRYQEYSSEEESFEDDPYIEQTPKLASSFKIRKQKTIIFQSPEKAKNIGNQSSVVSGLNIKRKRMTHVRIGDRENLTFNDKNQAQINGILKSEGRKHIILKPINEVKRDSMNSIVNNNNYKDTSLGIYIHTYVL